MSVDTTEPFDFDTRVKLAVYRHFADFGRAPKPKEIAERTQSDVEAVLASYRALRRQRVLVLDDESTSIVMAPPFSGIPTQHRVEADSIEYYANCAWDALGVPAALGCEAVVRSRCEQSMEPLTLEVGLDGPVKSDWIFHCLVPAAHWWDDIVFT
jgi:hypothetical protein